MWSSLGDVYLAFLALLLMMNINAVTIMGFPLEDSENNEKIGDESDPNQETNQKENDSDAHSTTPCYETENFTIAGPCAPCQPFHSKALSDACSETGFNQLVQCANSHQKVYKSCPRTRESLERSFWLFEGVTLLIGMCFSVVVFCRRRKLNHEAAERVRKQISNSV